MENQSPIAREGKLNFEPTFFGKVMAFFALAIACSCAGVYLASNYFMDNFIAMPSLMWIITIIELALVFTARMWSTKYPINRLLFAAFAFISGVTIAPLIAILAASPEGVAIITKALLATTLMFGATAIFGWTTKMNLSSLKGFLMISLIGLLIVGLIGIFIPWSNTMEMIYSGAGVLIFSGFVVYDINKLKYYPEDRYIDAALNLYLDIFNLFIFILRLIMSRRD
ncbi:MAG: Bax inhibitor-1/YccA family protein [Patescibacteria group bacterium]